MTTDQVRPGYHFTAPVGWINDPLGVTWHESGDGGRYELFFQFNPDAPVWAPACRWGQATSPDLVRWADPRTALEPGPDETGCWSGSVVVHDGVPVIVYTSVVGDSMDLGRVALARGDAEWRSWTPDPGGPVIPAPPPEQGLAHVRDPSVWRDGEEWRMALGAGDTAGRPSVLQYSSPDLRRWRLDGVLAEPEPGVPDPGGALWECPQLFPLDGAWVLIVSVWDHGAAGVACAVGDYDGRRFTARSWHPLASDPLYATTAFADRQGRRCALSWIQEAGSAGGAWSGALTVPWLLGLDGDRVTVTPHPDVDALRTGLIQEHGPARLSGVPLTVGPLTAQADVVLSVDPAGGPVELTLDDAGNRLLTVSADPRGEHLRLAAPDRPVALVPLHPAADGSLEVRLLVDAGVVEVFAGGRVGAARLLPLGGHLSLGITGADGARLRHLSAYEMERITG